MKINHLASFTLGVIVTAVSVAGVSYVNASTNKQITACANKKTGVMRYITKGKCKKTEQTLKWNQQGPQGAQGPQGNQGVQGSAGKDGATPTPTATQTDASVIDNAGNYLGKLLNVNFGSTFDEYTILRDSKYFTVGSDGRVYGDVYYTEPGCTGTPFVAATDINKRLPRNRLLLTYSEGSTAVLFFEYATEFVSSTLTAKSMLSDHTATQFGDPMIYDGQGNCTAVDFTWDHLASRTLREIPAPVIIDTSGPLNLVISE